MSTHPMKRFGKEGSSENSLHSAGVLNCGGTTSCLKDLLKDAAHLPPHSAIFWHLMSVDAVGVSHEGIPRYIGSPPANVPSFLSWWLLRWLDCRRLYAFGSERDGRRSRSGSLN